jgi:hypothetical protein
MAGRQAAGAAPTAAGDPVIERAFTLMSGFDPAHRVLSLSDLARRSGMPVSTALRLARQLVAQGALERRGRSYVMACGCGNWLHWRRGPRGCARRRCR